MQLRCTVCEIHVTNNTGLILQIEIQTAISCCCDKRWLCRQFSNTVGWAAGRT